jgi:hypothetical protein
MGFFGKPKPGPAPRPLSATKLASTTNTSPASTTLKTPSSVAGSSPNIASSSQLRERASSPVKSAPAASLLTKGTPNAASSDEELTPPPTVRKKGKPVQDVRPVDEAEESMEVEEEAVTADSPVISVSLFLLHPPLHSSTVEEREAEGGLRRVQFGRLWL